MAKTLTIYYCGLITHLGDDTNDRAAKDIAAVIKDRDHEPIVVVNGLIYMLMSSIEFPEMSEGRAIAQPDFLASVPSLLTVFGEDVSAVNLARNAFFVPYPAGSTLHVQENYRCEAVHRRDTEERRTGCVARITRLVANNIDDAARIRFTSDQGVKDLELPDQSEVLVTNWSRMRSAVRDCGLGNPHGHVQKFGKILKRTRTVTVQETGNECNVEERNRVAWIEDLLDRAPLVLGTLSSHDTDDGDAGHDHTTKRSGVQISEHETTFSETSDNRRAAAELKFVTLTSSHVECGNTDWP